ncbi:uncharacterized protein LOC116535802 [Sapajus apella]|uniref:Uncharacterized protein LOC116535802 n=1 Tax=Sapajus apella TaxID=9515 RepID=A0A6J3G610_SAPAP|nr:uncharacterized protein LOC116535802 [Sapajus apella]
MWAISLTFSPSVFHLRVARCTGESGAEYFAPRAGEQRTVIFLHATRRRKRKREGRKKKKKAPDTQSMARRSDCLASRIPLGSVENEPREGNFNSSTTPCRALRFPRVGRSRVQPASASCSWGAVTSQIPASLFIPFCSGSKTPAVFTPALAGPAPGARGGPGWRRQRLRQRWVAAAAAPPPRGQCRPRAALRRPPRDRCRPPRSVAECYPVLNVTLTHSIPDTTALTSSIHAARAAIGRASRPGGAVLPLRPFITPGRGLRRRRGVGGAGDAGDAGSRGLPGCERLAGGLVERGAARGESRGPAARPGQDVGLRRAGDRRRLRKRGGPGRRNRRGPRASRPRAPWRIRSPGLPAGTPREGCFESAKQGGKKDLVESDCRSESCLSQPSFHSPRPSVSVFC